MGKHLGLPLGTNEQAWLESQRLLREIRKLHNELYRLGPIGDKPTGVFAVAVYMETGPMINPDSELLSCWVQLLTDEEERELLNEPANRFQR